MSENSATAQHVATSIAPMLSVRNGAKAIDFYKTAFGATEAFRVDAPDGSVVARLSVEGAEFGSRTNRRSITTSVPSRSMAAPRAWCSRWPTRTEVLIVRCRRAQKSSCRSRTITDGGWAAWSIPLAIIGK